MYHRNYGPEANQLHVIWKNQIILFLLQDIMNISHGIYNDHEISSDSSYNRNEILLANRMRLQLNSANNLMQHFNEAVVGIFRLT